MNWIKENKSLAGILGVMIVGAIGLGVLLFMSYSTYTQSVESWNTTSANVTRLKSAKLYPDQANVTAKEDLVSAYAEKVNLLRSTLLDARVQQPVKPLSETEFQAKLKDRANTVKRLAESAQVLLPAEFALGFDEYTGSLPRTPEVAAELNVHLDVMEKLLTAMIQSGIKSVDMLERTKLSDEKAPAAAPVAPKPTSKTAASRNRAKGKNRTIITAEAAAEPVLDRYPIKLMLTTDQGPFQNIMNTLSNPGKMPHFLVVRLLRVENEKVDGPLKSEIRISRDIPTTESDLTPPAAPDAAAAGGQAILAPKPAPKDAVTIMGEEKLKLYLEIDYIRFRPAATVEESDAPATTAAVTK